VSKPDNDPDLGTGVIAEMAGVDPKTVARWIDRGILGPATKSPYGHRRCRRSVVEAFLKTLHLHEVTE
jgi:DNA-binding transcriptional MerR regulator